MQKRAAGPVVAGDGDCVGLAVDAAGALVGAADGNSFGGAADDGADALQAISANGQCRD